MATRKKRGALPKKAGIETPGWLLTFGDLNSLLLTFFVLLISLSVPQQPKMKDVISSFNNAFGPVKSKAADMAKSKIPLHKAQGVVDMPVNRRQEFQRKVEDRVHEKGFGPHAQFEKTPQGFRVRLKEQMVFEGGSVELQPEGLAFVAMLAPLVRESDFDLRIEGHTDSVPYHSDEIESNWELSALRAVSVLNAFQKLGNVPPDRLSAVGYGPNRPVASNESAENRLLNRRVDIYFNEREPVPKVEPPKWQPGSHIPIPTVESR